MKISNAPIVLAFALLSATSSNVDAQHAQTRQGFGISFGLGNGSVACESDFCSTDRQDGGSGYLRIGGYARPNLFVGGESSSWNYSNGDVDQQLGFLTAVVQWYPNPTLGLYLRGGAGFAGYSATDGTDEITAGAMSLTAGIGYDFRVSRNFSLTPYLHVSGTSKGELLFNDVSTGVHPRASLVQLGLGFTWH